jgi:predicted DNA-binding protein YlxM (UPF0122 family)
MFEKNMRLAYLLDFYGEALDEHTKEIMKAYYEDDLSLSEIALGEGISRQGVRHIIKKGEEQLEFLEEKLMLADHHKTLRTAAEKLLLLKKTLTEDFRADYSNEAALLDEVITIILSK